MKTFPFSNFDISKGLDYINSDEAYDNELNIKCSVCGCWVSKRIEINGLCPDCRKETRDNSKVIKED